MLDSKLQELTDKIHNGPLRMKVLDFLEDPSFRLDGKVYSGPSFDVSPEGITHHHTCEGGYLEHVLATEKIASALCDVAEKICVGKVDRNLVTAEVLLHDIYKPITYINDENSGFTSSSLVDYLDHIP